MSILDTFPTAGNGGGAGTGPGGGAGTGPGPTAPPKPTPTKADEQVFAAVEDILAHLDLPARRVPAGGRVPDDTAAASGGLGLNHPLVPGEEPTPGSAVAAVTAARESTGAVVAPGAGADVPGGKVPGCTGRGGGAVAAATFSLPVTPRFAMAEGDHRPIGSVQPLT